MKINRRGNLVVAKEGYEVTIDDLGEDSITITSYTPFDLSKYSTEDIEKSKSLRMSFEEGWLLDYKEGMTLSDPPKETRLEIKKVPRAEDVNAYTRARVKIVKEKSTPHATPSYSYDSEIDKSVFEKIEKGKALAQKERLEEQQRIIKAISIE